MASLADMLVKSGLDSAQQTGADINQGAQLAQTAQNIVKSREDIEQAKQDLQLKKVEKLTNAMEIGAKMPSKSARNAYFKNYIPNMQAALGLQDFIPPETMAMIQADPEQAKKFSLLKSKIVNGEMSFEQAVANMQPEEWAMLEDKEVQQLEAADKFRVQQANSTTRTELVSGRNQREDIDSLRKELTMNPVSKETKEINSSYDRVQEAFSKAPTAAGDLSGIFAYMKMLDPASTVREGEFANAQNASGIPDRVANLYNRAISGERLNPDQRKDFLNQAKKISIVQQRRQDTLNKQYSDIARERGYDPKQILAGISPGAAKDWKALVSKQKDAFMKMSAEGQAEALKRMSERFGVSPEEIKKEFGAK